MPGPSRSQIAEINKNDISAYKVSKQEEWQIHRKSTLSSFSQQVYRLVQETRQSSDGIKLSLSLAIIKK